EVLSDEGYAVIDTAEGSAVLELIAREKPALVLLDIWMPDTDGVTLLKEWQRDGLLTMPVIMMSGHATIDTAVEATRIGAMDFLEKPITLQRLLKTIEAGLSRGRAPIYSGSATSAQASMAVPLEDELDPPSAAASADAQPQVGNGQLGNISLDQPLRDARDAFERIYFEYHLVRENHSMTRVSERTGLERTHLYRKLKQLGIESARKRSS
ncbi:MAG: response regulator, partial [Bordetella sp.]|uniref:response regulator n=1 Tax=Bordetella sp. TaxID=28081 RepID=UPI003F7BDDE9